jgi:hypothetical protein
MAIITDPDQLNQATEVTINTATKRIALSVAGNLSTDGVTLKCLYSFLKEEWKADSNLIKYPFPLQPITDEQFELINNWDFEDDPTRYLIRTGGWALKDAAGVSLEEWAGVISLGSLGATDQVYFTQVDGGVSTNIQLTGRVNQAIKIYGDGTHGNIDYRAYLKLICREYQKTYAAAALTDIGVQTMTYQVYRFPLSNATDLKVTHNDVTSEAYGVTITWYGAPQSRTIGGTAYNFNVIIDGNNKDAEEIYEAVQRALRQASDIDAGGGTKTGKVTNELLYFVGDTLKCKRDGSNGVYIDNFQSDDTNRIVMIDNTGAEKSFPFVAILKLQFGDNLINDANAIYRIFLTNANGKQYGTANAVLAKDDANADMAGPIAAQAVITHTFAYDSNVQEGRTAGTDADITVVAIGLDTAQFVKATGTIQRSVSNVVSLVASLERNYDNS